MKSWWSVPQACTWAATRDLDAVDTAPNSLPDTGEAPAEGSSLPSAGWALIDLHDLSASGEITIQGRRRGQGDPELIPPHIWTALLIRCDSSAYLPSDRDRVIASPRHDFSGDWWTNLLVRRADAERVWPPMGRDGRLTVEHGPEPLPRENGVPAMAAAAGNRALPDAEITAQVVDAFDSGKHKSVRAAAFAILPELIQGGGTSDSKHRRIAAKARDVIEKRKRRGLTIAR